jgi:hypothetical protein
MKVLVSAYVVAVALSGCGARRKRQKDDNITEEGTDENEGRSKPTKDPDLVFDPSKTSCKSICSGIDGCPVKQAHCKKEVDPPVCWALYYTADDRTDWCFFRKDPLNCPEQFPIYCEPDSGLILPDFRPPTTTTAAPKKRMTTAP